MDENGDEVENDTKWNIEEKPVKIDKWDTAAVKNALDDAAKKVMKEKFGYVESHRLMDLRLLICTIAVGFSLFALVWDYLRPFPESRPVLIICVLSYFVLMGILTLYTTYMEKGIFLVALQKDEAGVDPDDRWELASMLKKYDDMYHLSMTFQDGKTGITRTKEISKCVANYFDENGLLCFDLFEPEITQLQSKISAEGKKD
ncbi:signal peptidase complex subunit 2-like isoform X2 [Crassostrea virginica]|uniref:Signal peptidase complex subunit 2 n=1 Tax=Crassostrea virginica TaxID=6565 RepID=A0A8B8AHF2_CRAVI|nr:probable signal peptidase complex subunit 2 isoform X2 [Crassostrea virginica]